MREIIIAFVGALVGSSIWAAIYSYYTKRRDDRRSLYATGMRLLSQREELYYIILRRNKRDKSQKNDLIRRVHENQMLILEHQALLSVDSYWLGASFKKAVKLFRASTEMFFRDAWSSPLKDSVDSVPEKRRIDTSQLIDSYVTDCRRRLNPIRSGYNTLIRWFWNK